MRLKIINSGSEGNAYILENDEEALLIECGVHIYDIKKALDFQTSKVVACILTHEHGDHAKSIKEVMAAGIDVYATKGTFEACGVQDNHRAIVTKSGGQFAVGGFKVKAFDVKHDVREPVGFIINHEETGNILFLTDTYMCEYQFHAVGLHNIIIEANYCQKVIQRRLAAGEEPGFLRDRIITSHMSLENCKGLLAANDLSKVNNIVLIHLSNRNSDANRFQQEVEGLTGKVTHIAQPGLVIENFHKQPF